MIDVAVSFTPKQPFGLVTCYFVYKVITNKVFKKVTCQLLGWWIPFPQWKHAPAEASNFLSCTPPKLQCRDCLVINRARTVPSLCMRLGSRESGGEGGIPSDAPDYRPRFQYSSRRLRPASSYTLLTSEMFFFFFDGRWKNKSGNEDSFITRV